MLGKLPPPYMGPAIATQIILQSELKNRFQLVHLDTRINTSVATMGKWGFGKVRKNFDVYLRMKKILKEEKPDLVWVPISQTTLGFVKDAGFIWLASGAGRKTIIQLRGSNFKKWISGSSAATRVFVRSVLKKTQGCIVLGEKLRHIFSEYYSPDKIFVVPNGADYTVPKRSSEPGGFKILYLANLFRSKGVEDVFEAISILKRSGIENFSADFIGEWADEEIKIKCLDLVEKEQLPVRIHSSSVSKNKFDFLSSADVFVFPPREPEGHPWCIVEAMAAGLPVISTDQGAITESVIDNSNGFIVNPAQPNEIASKLRLLIEDPHLRTEMGKQSRSYYEQKFTEEKMVENLTKVFNELLSK